MEAKKREKIAILVRAGTAPKEICRLVGTTQHTIISVRKHLETGDNPHPAPRKARKPLKRTPRAVAAVRRKIKADPHKPITRIAEEAGMHRTTAARIIKEIGGQSLRRKKCPLFSEAARKRRLERSRGLINDLKSASLNRIIFFNDEKNFVVDPAFNPQNDRYIRIGGPARGTDAGGDGPRPEYMPRSK